MESERESTLRQVEITTPESQQIPLNVQAGSLAPQRVEQFCDSGVGITGMFREEDLRIQTPEAPVTETRPRKVRKQNREESATNNGEVTEKTECPATPSAKQSERSAWLIVTTEGAKTLWIPKDRRSRDPPAFKMKLTKPRRLSEENFQPDGLSEVELTRELFTKAQEALGIPLPEQDGRVQPLTSLRRTGREMEVVYWLELD